MIAEACTINAECNCEASAEAIAQLIILPTSEWAKSVCTPCCFRQPSECRIPRIMTSLAPGEYNFKRTICGVNVANVCSLLSPIVENEAKLPL